MRHYHLLILEKIKFSELKTGFSNNPKIFLGSIYWQNLK